MLKGERHEVRDRGIVDPADNRGDGGGDTGGRQMPEGRHCPVVAPFNAAEAVMDLGKMAVDADPDLGETGFLERSGRFPVDEPAIAVHGDTEADSAGERCNFQQVWAQERLAATEVDGK